MAGFFVALTGGVTAEVTHSPDGIKVRYGKLLEGSMFVPSIEKFFASSDPEASGVWKSGWDLRLLLALLKKHLGTPEEASSAVAAMAHKVMLEIHAYLNYGNEPYWPRIVFLAAILRLLSRPDAEVMLAKLAKRKGAPKAIRDMKAA